MAQAINYGAIQELLKGKQENPCDDGEARELLKGFYPERSFPETWQEVAKLLSAINSDFPETPASWEHSDSVTSVQYDYIVLAGYLLALLELHYRKHVPVA